MTAAIVAVVVLGAVTAIDRWITARRTEELLVELIAEVRALRKAAER